MDDILPTAPLVVNLSNHSLTDGAEKDQNKFYLPVSDGTIRTPLPPALQATLKPRWTLRNIARRVRAQSSSCGSVSATTTSNCSSASANLVQSEPFFCLQRSATVSWTGCTPRIIKCTSDHYLLKVSLRSAGQFLRYFANRKTALTPKVYDKVTPNFTSIFTKATHLQPSYSVLDVLSSITV